MNRKKRLQTVAVLVVSALVPIATIAFSNSGDSNGPQHGPPPEAIKACEGKQAGDTTSFTGRQGETLTATCKEIKGQLAAVPEGGPR
ncbi:MAG: hypothetical protein WBB19_04870 [Desulforhopalus sp.]